MNDSYTKIVDMKTGEVDILPPEDPWKSRKKQLRNLDPEMDTPMYYVARSLIKLATRKGQEASDIHIFQKGRTIKLRIDSFLYAIDIANLIGEINPNEFFRRLVSMFKVMSKMDIAEKRLPQGGSFSMKVVGKNGAEKTLFFRVNTLPEEETEKMAIRILDPESYRIPLQQLGHSNRIMKLARYLSSFKSKSSLLLITGPTGHGKTTTQYALLHELYERTGGSINIVTIEDPVEYQMEKVTQVPVNKKLGFAKALRSILRDDPDVVLVGEIRDSETAKIAVQAALTGHLVIGTVHANSAMKAISRMFELGISYQLLSESLLGVISQVLVRRICENCIKKRNLKVYIPNEKRSRILYGNEIPHFRFLCPLGCTNCHEGFKKLTALSELFVPSPTIREMISRGVSLAEIEAKAYQEGFLDMRVSAQEKVKKVITTVEEAARVLCQDFEDLGGFEE